MGGFFEKFRASRSGSVFIMFGVSAMVLFGIAGIAIDYSKAHNVKSKLMAALEASALASAKLLDADAYASDADIEALAKRYFDAHMQNYQLGDVSYANFKAIPQRQQHLVETKIDVSLGSLFGRLANIQPTIDFTPKVSVSYSAKKIELVMVLDITGSMNAPGKMDALKEAAKGMVDALYAANPMAGAVRVGMVPYAGSVNAGSWVGAIRKSSKMTPSVDPHSPTTYTYPTDNCVVERSGSNAYGNASPTSTSNKLEFSSTDANPAYSCPPSVIVPLADLSDGYSRNTFKAQIDSLMPLGGTAGHIGLAMGWYMVSPEWAGIWPISPRPYDPDQVIKVVVFMTDGMLNLSYNNGGENITYGTAQSVDPESAGSSPYQALQLCQNMTTSAGAQQRVRLYTVAFQAPPNAEALLQQCSGSGNYYTASSTGDLFSAFQEIVQNLLTMQLQS